MSAASGRRSGAGMRALRELRGYTQGSWGRHVGVSTTTVCRWEAGVREPTEAQWLALERLPVAEGEDRAPRAPPKREAKEAPPGRKKPRAVKRTAPKKSKTTRAVLHAEAAGAVLAEDEVLDADAIGAQLLEDVERVGTAARALAGGAQ